MANGVNTTSSAAQIATNYEKYKEYFSTDSTNDELGQDAFLALMVEQMKNQDILEPTDNSEYIAQMAQFSSLQEMQNMSYYSNANYATSLVGKTVSLGAFDNETGQVVDTVGVVQSVVLEGKNFAIMVNGTPYELKNVMEVMESSQIPDKDDNSEPELSALEMIGNFVKIETINSDTNEIEKFVGFVESLALDENGEYQLVIDGKQYKVDDVVEILGESISEETTDDSTDETVAETTNETTQENTTNEESSEPIVYQDAPPAQSPF